ncbi:hypothetical protein LR48_Vigan05g022800 [Vigna angularis]|uniref:Uncharacterized protein n=1 Tax=Phaseolus angularis TaxID=3914 RepID=A0A0L9UJ91_PHAAN|nr:hypothetical protein LR48_Vigan05g022800 [Vigna angularis]
MGKLLSDSTTIAEPFQGSPPAVLPWRDPKSESITAVGLVVPRTRHLLCRRPPILDLSFPDSHTAARNCLFTASRKAMGLEEVDARELRRKTVTRFSEDLRYVRFAAADDDHVVQEVKLLAKKEDLLLEWFCDGEEDEIESHKRVLVRRLISGYPERREDEVGVGEEEEKVSTYLRFTVPHVIKCQLTMPQDKKFNAVYDS